ncbi:MAG TPA: hypothetical protein VM029_21520 [Opitutaceae bacterium]|nr:hypothetical protein [Opitutaceae bacterium]
MNTLSRPFAAVLLCVAASFQAPAASVLPLYLDEMIDTATTAFEGRVTGNRTERDPATKLVVTYTTFEVLDPLKGAVGATHEIKQIGGVLPGEGLAYRVNGGPTFTVGEEYVVFLAGKSAVGFSSPIGLGQGKFGVNADARGRRVANGRDFKDMTSRIKDKLPPSAKAKVLHDDPVREMDIDDFKRTVRNHLESKR